MIVRLSNEGNSIVSVNAVSAASSFWGKTSALSSVSHAVNPKIERQKNNKKEVLNNFIRLDEYTTEVGISDSIKKSGGPLPHSSNQNMNKHNSKVFSSVKTNNGFDCLY